MGFGMRQQAVELALKVDPSLARELARNSMKLDEQKRLWLMIAKNAASEGEKIGKDVVARVVAVLRDCGPEILSIEDVLPFLPDFAQIDEIKEEITSALTAYSTKIEALSKEMQECDQTCDSLREEINRLRNHHMHMRGNAKCAFTKKQVMVAGEPFYVFPSGYVALESALRNEVLPILNDKQRNRVREIDEEMLSMYRRHQTGEPINTKKEKDLQAELDGMIAAECPLTGSVMVNSIDKGFFEGGVDEDEVFFSSMMTDSNGTIH
mmetsp:Transcript_819/g.1166  ORF Transcript_819/g.1166 Transcript_819/m.1166 type:complete len:266 (+) Transcript_819:1-798(+)